MISKSRLAMGLSKLRVFPNPKIKSEQYATDSEIAATILTQAQMLGDISGKIIADFGAGTGILGIGCLMLGAKKVYFVEQDKEAMPVLRVNVEGLHNSDFKGSSIYFEGRVEDFEITVDTVIQNPPFGTKVRHSDRVFLERAMAVAPVIYSVHKSTTEDFIEAFSSDNGFRISHFWDYELPLRATLKHHKKRVFYTKVRVYRLTKEG